jgi:hypothetical protein
MLLFLSQSRWKDSENRLLSLEKANIGEAVILKEGVLCHFFKNK